MTYKHGEYTHWLALNIGNSRLHWAWFVEGTLQQAWDTDYLSASVVNQLSRAWNTGEWLTEIFLSSLTAHINSPPNSTPQTPHSLYLASVVPSQTALWQTYPNVHIITIDQLPLQGLYPTLGIDRALALWGAGENWGWPMLTIDAGTALTFTGADVERRLVGGAILPGLGLQVKFLAQETAALPFVNTPDLLPPRWALNTQTAIQSGILYTLVAGIKDFVEAWWQEFPDSRITLTGGDCALLLNCLRSQFPEVAAQVIADPHLVFWGIRQRVMSSR